MTETSAEAAFAAMVAANQVGGGGLLFSLDWRALSDYSTRVYSPYEAADPLETPSPTSPTTTTLPPGLEPLTATEKATVEAAKAYVYDLAVVAYELLENENGIFKSTQAWMLDENGDFAHPNTWNWGDEKAQAGGDPGIQAGQFIQWWNDIQTVTADPYGIWTNFIKTVAWDFSGVLVDGESMRRDFITVGPLDNPTGIFQADKVNALLKGTGIDSHHLDGPDGWGLLGLAAETKLPLHLIFDIAESVDWAETFEPVEGVDQGQQRAQERALVHGAVKRFNHAMTNGVAGVKNYMIAKVYALGTNELALRMVGLNSGSMDAQLTAEEMNEIQSILGADWYSRLEDSPASSAKDMVAASAWQDYENDWSTLTGPVTVPGESMREAARTLAASWRIQPLSDDELNNLINDFGEAVRASNLYPNIWDTGAQGGVREAPNEQVAVMRSMRSSPDYQRLYGNMPTGMGEEQYAGQMASASSDLMGYESRIATEAGMESGDRTLAQQVALTDPSARGSTYYRRLSAMRRAFR
jgi:hypothetical protein